MKFEFEGRIDYFSKEGSNIKVIGTSTKGLCIDEETYNSMSYENLEKDCLYTFMFGSKYTLSIYTLFEDKIKKTASIVKIDGKQVDDGFVSVTFKISDNEAISLILSVEHDFIKYIKTNKTYWIDFSIKDREDAELHK